MTNAAIRAENVHDIIARYQLADGMPLVADLDRSKGIWLHDARSGRDFLDAFTCFASWPIGYNHPMMADGEFLEELRRAASTKVSNADLYTPEMARFIDAFGSRVTPESHPHHFFISGGGLAVENALKVAFDWKARKLGRTDFHDDVNDLVIAHFEHAFHGRTGYTMSLTNTLPDKVGLYPKFDWPRIPSPAIEFDLDGAIVNDVEAAEKHALAELDKAFRAHPNKIAAIIIEPIQAEGGDRHFRPEFLAALRDIADREEALLIFDEVQTGFFGTGKPWLWQILGVEPDVVAFGKKTQVCGIFANTRVDEIEENVFARSSRINSTWGGNLVDMVRCRRIIEIVEAEDLAQRTSTVGAAVLDGVRALARETGVMASPRGIGSFIAFTAPSPGMRNRMLQGMFEEGLLVLPCGPDAIRFRLPLVMQEAEVGELLTRAAKGVRRAIGSEMVGAG